MEHIPPLDHIIPSIPKSSIPCKQRGHCGLPEFASEVQFPFTVRKNSIWLYRISTGQTQNYCNKYWNKQWTLQQLEQNIIWSNHKLDHSSSIWHPPTPTHSRWMITIYSRSRMISIEFCSSKFLFHVWMVGIMNWSCNLARTT